MKESNYNKLYKRRILFNSMTCALAVVDKDYFEAINIVKNCETPTTPSMIKLIDNMKRAGFLIGGADDEISRLKYRYYKNCFREDSFYLTIAPTLDCNFRCPYCYEKHIPGEMTIEIQNSILEFLYRQMSQVKRLHVEWYGGEPLLAPRAIRYLSEKINLEAQRANIIYSASMVSNGYLLNKVNIKLLQDCQIKRVQVTIDGPPNIHNLRRKLKGASIKDTFTRILANIQEVIFCGIKVKLRINIDTTNMGDLDELFSILVKSGLGEIPFYFGCVEKSSDFCMGSEDYLEYEEFAKISTALYRTAIRTGMQKKYIPFPYPKRVFCGACRKASLVIDPKGNLYKCWHDIGNAEEIVGNIIDFSQQDESKNPNFIKWFQKSPFENKECIQCYYLPICMGGCPKKRMNGKKSCERWRYIMEELIAIKMNRL